MSDPLFNMNLQTLIHLAALASGKRSLVSSVPIVPVARAGTKRAARRETIRSLGLRYLYADTPKHGPTRQQQRHAARKAAKSARA